MAVNREELKRLIDQIPEQDALQVYDFIGYLNMKREDREQGRIYGREAGLEYLRAKIKECQTNSVWYIAGTLGKAWTLRGHSGIRS